jgi:hypothetical protein
MTTPNPSGTVRCTFWDKLALAQTPKAEEHWSYDMTAARKSILAARAARRQAKLNELLSLL